MKALKDPLVKFIESEIDTVEIISSYFPTWLDISQNVTCPFHADNKTPSLHIDPSGKGYCHGCGHSFRDIIDLVAQLEERDYTIVLHETYADLVHAIPESEVDAYVINLHKNKKALDWLAFERNISLQVLKEFKIGYEPVSKRLTIPIYDQFGCCINIRRMGWLKSHRKKALNVKGKGAVRLYPEKNLALERRVLLVEGEWDMLCARSFGLPAVTWTGGASNWNDEYTARFKDKAVWICYDRDKAGEAGGEQASVKLAGVVEYVNYMSLPPDVEGNDITEWSFIYPEILEFFGKCIKQYQFPKRVGKKKVCPSCGQEIKK